MPHDVIFPTAVAERVRITRQKWRLSVLVPPASLPVTIAELQDQARLLFPGEPDPCDGAEDALLTRYIATATDELDSAFGWLGRSLIPRTLRLTLDEPPPKVVELPGVPVTSVEQIAYTDPAGVDQVILKADLAANGFRLDLDDTGNPALIWVTNGFAWPETIDDPAKFRIDYIAGYADAAAIPDILKHWILVKAATKYRDREDSVIGTIVAQLQHVERLMDNFRVRM